MHNFPILDGHDRDESVLVGRTTADDTPMDLVLDDNDRSIVAAVHDKSVAAVSNAAVAIAADKAPLLRHGSRPVWAIGRCVPVPNQHETAGPGPLLLPKRSMPVCCARRLRSAPAQRASGGGSAG